MASKRTMTLNLTAAEMEAVEEPAAKKDLSKTAIMRQALRLYQMVDSRIERGDKLFFEDEEKKEKAEVMVLLARNWSNSFAERTGSLWRQASTKA